MKGTLTTIALFAAALLAAGGAAYFANDYIDSSIAQRQADLEAQYEKVEVIVADKDLVTGDVLSNRTVKKRPVPRAFMPVDAVTATEWQSIAGALLTIPVKGGEPVLRSYLATNPGAGFSATLPEGMRALTFPVNDESSIAGFLAPGDRIDLLFTTSNGTENMTVPLLYAVPVIATGVETLTNARTLSENQAQGSYRTVTVAVTPEDAAKITLAKDAGQITVALRRAEDASPLTLAAVTKQTLLYGVPVKKPGGKPRNRIELILGGK
jgi:pilus assembly protein CpaB